MITDCYKEMNESPAQRMSIFFKIADLEGKRIRILNLGNMGRKYQELWIERNGNMKIF